LFFREDCVTITTAVLLPGYPTDFCFVSETGNVALTIYVYIRCTFVNPIFHFNHFIYINVLDSYIYIVFIYDNNTTKIIT